MSTAAKVRATDGNVPLPSRTFGSRLRPGAMKIVLPRGLRCCGKVSRTTHATNPGKEANR